jgi:hypothetical protein
MYESTHLSEYDVETRVSPELRNELQRGERRKREEKGEGEGEEGEEKRGKNKKNGIRRRKGGETEGVSPVHMEKHKELELRQLLWNAVTTDSKACLPGEEATCNLTHTSTSTDWIQLRPSISFFSSFHQPATAFQRLNRSENQIMKRPKLIEFFKWGVG